MTRTKKEDSSQLHSSQSLANSVLRVEQLLASARRIAAEMDRLKTGDLFIGMQPSFHCALSDLSRWGKACEDAFTLKLQETGHFRAEAGTTPPRQARPPQKAEKEKKVRKTSR
jgi:hypothetical protein